MGDSEDRLRDKLQLQDIQITYDENTKMFRTTTPSDEPTPSGSGYRTNESGTTGGSRPRSSSNYRSGRDRRSPRSSSQSRRDRDRNSSSDRRKPEHKSPYNRPGQRSGGTNRYKIPRRTEPSRSGNHSRGSNQAGSLKPDANNKDKIVKTPEKPKPLPRCFVAPHAATAQVPRDPVTGELIPAPEADLDKYWMKKSYQDTWIDPTIYPLDRDVRIDISTDQATRGQDPYYPGNLIFTDNPTSGTTSTAVNRLKHSISQLTCTS